MSVSRTLAGPALGTAVAGLVLYSVGSSLSTRTHQVTGFLHGSSSSLRRLAEVDDTRDLVQSAHIAPDTATMVSEVDGMRSLHPATGSEAGARGQARDYSVLPAAYRPLGSTSLKEQIKERWNEHLTSLAYNIADADVESTYHSMAYFARSAYARVTGGEAPIKPQMQEAGNTIGQRIASGLQAIAPSVPASATGATLREPVPPRLDARLAAPNTHYLGQGASLR